MLPLVMVDSGNQISDGYVSYYNVYNTMVNDALIRPALAEIQAYWWQTGNKVQFYVKVKNLSNITLSYDNKAAVHAIVYEDANINCTDRFGRADAFTWITSLEPNSTGVFILETLDLDNDVNWEKLHFVVLVDYQPLDDGGRFDTLQAAVAEPLPGPFIADPDTVTILIDPTDPDIPEITINLISSASEEWYATPNEPWLIVTPSSASISTQAIISVDPSQLSGGWQAGTVTFSNLAGDLSDEVLVNTYFGSINRVFLPVVEK